jgi:hypothetical protein
MQIVKGKFAMKDVNKGTTMFIAICCNQRTCDCVEIIWRMSTYDALLSLMSKLKRITVVYFYANFIVSL